MSNFRRYGHILAHMTQLRIADCAELLGVSDDTVRRWVDSGKLPAGLDGSGRRVVEGADLARVTQDLANPPQPGVLRDESARNRMRGIVTRVVRDTVMAQVELQTGPFRIVSLMSREAADDLGLEVGSVAVASIKSTHVVVGVPK